MAIPIGGDRGRESHVALASVSGTAVNKGLKLVLSTVFLGPAWGALMLDFSKPETAKTGQRRPSRGAKRRVRIDAAGIGCKRNQVPNIRLKPQT